MPKSKRAKVVALSKVKKKGRDSKEKLVENIHKSVDEYKYLYVLQSKNMTTNPFKKIRKEFNDSKFYLGKNKVMQFALGKSPEEEYKDNLWLISKYIKDEWCLLFTNNDDVEEYFSNYSSKDFARAGEISPKTVILPKGGEALEAYSFAMEPHLRSLGLPTKLVREKINLLVDYTVAVEGKALTSEQWKLLKLLGHRFSEFKLKVIARWESSTNEVEIKED